MFYTVEIVSIPLVAAAMAPALSHLLAFPGKARLTKDYLTAGPFIRPTHLMHLEENRYALYREVQTVLEGEIIHDQTQIGS